jgi:MSHA biogenesis protein MshG
MMAQFHYKARNAGGELLQGVMEGPDSMAVAHQLFSSGSTPIDITPAKETVRKEESIVRKGIFEAKIRPLDVQLFSRQMYTMLKAGVPIMRSLAALQEAAVNKSFARLLRQLRESLDSGRELSAAMQRFPHVFDPFYLGMIRVGEASGRLEEIFLRLFDHLEYQREMRERVRNALRYPMFVVIAIVAAIAVINLLVIPAFAKAYAGFKVELPLMTRILLDVSNFTVNYWPYLLALSVMALVGVRRYLNTRTGRYMWDRMKLRMPVFGEIMHKATMARFARSFALASQSSVPIVQGMSIVAQTVENQYIAGRIEKMREGIERGESILRTATVSGVFTPVVLQMIAIGEETGDLDGLMNEIAGMYEREVDYELKTMSAKIEPILIVALGVIVLILALGVFLPIWDLGAAAMQKK